MNRKLFIASTAAASAALAVSNPFPAKATSERWESVIYLGYLNAYPVGWLDDVVYYQYYHTPYSNPLYRQVITAKKAKISIDSVKYWFPHNYWASTVETLPITIEVAWPHKNMRFTKCWIIDTVSRYSSNNELILDDVSFVHAGEAKEINSLYH